MSVRHYGAIKIISEQLRRELPGLRGFSEEGIKKMRTFAEFWHHYLNPSPTATDLENRNTLAILGIEYVTRMQLRGGEASAEKFLTRDFFTGSLRRKFSHVRFFHGRPSAEKFLTRVFFTGRLPAKKGCGPTARRGAGNTPGCRPWGKKRTRERRLRLFAR